MNLKAEEELRKIWGRIPTTLGAINDTFDVAAYKKLLDIFQVGKYFYLILNVRESVYEYISPEIEEVLGYKGEDMNLPKFLSLLHPDDLPQLLNFENSLERFFKNVLPEQLFKYKTQYDFRLKKADGTYVRILNQMVIIQHDEDTVRTFLVNTDITHLKTDPVPRLSFIGMDGEPSYYNVDVENIFKPAKSMFTNREKDILKALAAGMRSQDIGSALNISKLTVDRHRKNMLKKTNAKSAGEVIRIAYDNGWI
jgi:DNA-binding CsgD family transcriptional regulator